MPLSWRPAARSAKSEAGEGLGAPPNGQSESVSLDCLHGSNKARVKTGRHHSAASAAHAVTAWCMLVTLSLTFSSQSQRARMLCFRITMSRWPRCTYVLNVYVFCHKGILNLPHDQQLAACQGLCCRSGNHSVQQVVWGSPEDGMPDPWDAV